MEKVIERFRNGRDEQELGSRLHGLCDDLGTKVRAISEMPAGQEVSNTGKSILYGYFMRLMKGVKGGHNQAIESNIVYAEVVCHTTLGVFDGSYIESICGTDESAAALREAVKGFEVLHHEIGHYEATRYGEHPLEREGTFGRIMRPIITGELRQHVQAIKDDDANFNEDFRRYASWAYGLIAQAVPPRGSIRLDILAAVLNNLSYDERKVKGLFPDNPAARIEAEGFLSDLRVMETLTGRYMEHRMNLD